MTNIIYFPGFTFQARKPNMVLHHGERFRNWQALAKTLSPRDYVRSYAWFERRVYWGSSYYGLEKPQQRDGGNAA